MGIQDLQEKMQRLLQVAQDADTLSAINMMLEALPLADSWTAEVLEGYIAAVTTLELAVLTPADHC